MNKRQLATAVAPQVQLPAAQVEKVIQATMDHLALEEPSFEIKQKVLQLVIDRIIIEDSRVVIRHIVPTGPVRLQTEQHLGWPR